MTPFPDEQSGITLRSDLVELPACPYSTASLVPYAGDDDERCTAADLREVRHALRQDELARETYAPREDSLWARLRSEIARRLS